MVQVRETIVWSRDKRNARHVIGADDGVMRDSWDAWTDSEPASAFATTREPRFR